LASQRGHSGDHGCNPCDAEDTDPTARMKALEISAVRGRRELREFIYLPSKVNRFNPRWIPPIYMDEWKLFDSRKNRSFQHADAVLALARRDGESVGRIMGIVNRRYNTLKQERTARFGSLDCVEDGEACSALLRYVEDWARGLGMNKLVGPMGFSEQDPEGLLVEGFDQEPTLVAFHNFPFLPRQVEACGYKKELDFVEYLVPLTDGIPAFYQKIATRVARQAGFTLLEFARTKELKPYIRRVLELMNATFVNIYGYVSMDEHEIDALAKQYLPVVDPRFVKLAVRGEEVLGFIIGMPNMNPGLRRCKGHLFPFGVLQVLAAMKKAKRLDLLLGGIREDFRGRGMDVLMGAAIMRSAIAAGFEALDSHREMETNLKMRAEMERVGGRVIKRFRVFQKPL